MGLLRRLVRLSAPGVPAAALPFGRVKSLFNVRATVQESVGMINPKAPGSRALEDTGTLAEIAPYAAAVYTGGTSMSIWAGLANVASSYLQYRAASRVAAPQPIQMSGPGQTYMAQPFPMQTMGALPQLGRALPLLGAAGGVVVAGARAAARSAMVYCRRHPNWCSTIGGTAAVAALIESGQLPTIRRRRGRGITPKDLRSFRRVANLVRGYCPTVRRIPSRQLHVRRTGISHA